MTDENHDSPKKLDVNFREEMSTLWAKKSFRWGVILFTAGAFLFIIASLITNVDKLAYGFPDKQSQVQNNRDVFISEAGRYSVQAIYDNNDLALDSGLTTDNDLNVDKFDIDIQAPDGEKIKFKWRVSGERSQSESLEETSSVLGYFNAPTKGAYKLTFARDDNTSEINRLSIAPKYTFIQMVAEIKGIVLSIFIALIGLIFISYSIIRDTLHEEIKK